MLAIQMANNNERLIECIKKLDCGKKNKSNLLSLTRKYRFSNVDKLISEDTFILISDNDKLSNWSKARKIRTLIYLSRRLGWLELTVIQKNIKDFYYIIEDTCSYCKYSNIKYELFPYLFPVKRCDSLAEDILQDVLEKVYKKYTIKHNVSYGNNKKKKWDKIISCPNNTFLPFAIEVESTLHKKGNFFYDNNRFGPLSKEKRTMMGKEIGLTVFYFKMSSRDKDYSEPIDNLFTSIDRYITQSKSI